MKKHLGQFYDKTSDFQQGQFLSLRALVEKTSPDRGWVKSLLDIGAGTGVRTLQCLDIFPSLEKITAIEPDRDMIETARASHADPRVNYLHMAVEDLPKLEDVYDGIISNWALHWISDKEKMMTDISSAARPGSLFMLSTCETLPSILMMVDDYIRKEFRVPAGNTPFFFLNGEEWKNLLDRHGWEISGLETRTVKHEAADAGQYLDHWFTASTAKFTYGRHIVELSPLSHSDLVWMMQRAFPSPAHKEGLSFTENTLFAVARKK